MTSSAEAWRICALEEDELEAVLELSVADARREQEELESPTPSSEASSFFYDDAFDYYLEELSAVHSEEENNAILRWEEDRDRAGLDFESETHVQMHTLLFTQHLAFWRARGRFRSLGEDITPHASSPERPAFSRYRTFLAHSSVCFVVKFWKLMDGRELDACAMHPHILGP